MKITITTHNAEQTIDIGRRFGELLEAGSIVALEGDLGAGKTTITKGIGLGLAVATEVHSPTFTLVHIYPGRLPLYHIDLYRLASEDDVETLGVEDYLFGDGVTVIEWAERMGSLMPKDRIGVTLRMLGDEDREIEFATESDRFVSVLEGLESYARARY
jgi:tRNA threonylcarbamoyladenosine biosynthesis protein TsaE